MPYHLETLKKRACTTPDINYEKQDKKDNRITYVYESKAYWDKEKQQSRARRTLIGKIDPETGEMIPTNGRHRKTEATQEKEPDYKKLYEKLQKKYEAQEILIKSLKEEIKQLKAGQ